MESTATYPVTAKLPSLTWQRKLNCDDIALSEFNLKLKEMVTLAPLGFRLWKYLQEEKAKGKDALFINPFIKRVYSSCQGVPIGGMGILLVEILEFLAIISIQSLGQITFSKNGRWSPRRTLAPHKICITILCECRTSKELPSVTFAIAAEENDAVHVSECPFFVISGDSQGITAKDMWNEVKKVI
ncbi:hypothetical protein H5410_010957 [Solanum commersonii]|uniref:Uncharacterized protein n=1 Tax=Solanum commersonii TaxID=4109 RepID=A0A9J6ANA4_SOLCO|nr:hypothetical protein H5410_010957 [Solanum commersonii]